MALKKSALAISKKGNYFLLPDHQLDENLILVFEFCEGRFVSRFIRITVTIIFV